jgi:hypothetical protein
VKYHPEFVLKMRGPLSIQVVRSLTEELLPKIVPDPDHLFDLSDGEIIKDEKKIKAARVKVEIESRVKDVYLKRMMLTLGGIDLAVLWWSFGRLIEAAELGLTRAASRWRHRSCSHPTANHSRDEPLSILRC